MEDNNVMTSLRAEYKVMQAMHNQHVETFFAKVEAFAEDHGLDADEARSFVTSVEG